MFGQRQGTPITEAQAKQAQTYIDLVGWQPTRWTTNNDTTYPQLIPNGYDTFEANIQGQKITDEQAKQRQTYVNAGWDFTNVWTIDEGESYPYFGKGEQSTAIGFVKVNGEIKRIVRAVAKLNGEIKPVNIKMKVGGEIK